MAQQITLKVYQINNMDPFPTATAPFINLPPAAILVRANAVTLSTGQAVAAAVQLITNGTQYYVAETPAAILTLCNA